MSVLEGIKPKYIYKRERINPAYPLFDQEDSDLGELSWFFVRGYPARNVRLRDANGQQLRRLPYAHRCVMERMLGRPIRQDEFVDHLNRNKLDCRRCNLKIVSKLENNQNTGPRARNTSGFRGVTWDKFTRRWKAGCNLNGKHFNAGRFDTAEEANAAAIALRKKLNFHGS